MSRKSLHTLFLNIPLRGIFSYSVRNPRLIAISVWWIGKGDPSLNPSPSLPFCERTLKAALMWPGDTNTQKTHENTSCAYVRRIRRHHRNNDAGTASSAKKRFCRELANSQFSRIKHPWALAPNLCWSLCESGTRRQTPRSFLNQGFFFCPEQLSKLVMAKADCHCNLSARRFFIFEFLMILPLSKIETPFGKVRCVVRLLLQLCWYLMAMEAFLTASARLLADLSLPPAFGKPGEENRVSPTLV